MSSPRSIGYAELPALAGQELGVSEWLTLDQERVDLFADATGDDQWVHVDVERATEALGGTIAHGYLTLSIIPLLARDIAHITGVAYGLNYGLNKVRFLKMIPVGARIRLRLALKSVEDRSGGRQAIYENTIEMEGADKPVCVAETIVLFLPS